MIDWEVYELKATANYAWLPPVYNFRRDVAFSLKFDKNEKGWGPCSVTRVTKNGIEDPFIKNGDLSEGEVFRLLGVSDDGKKLHIILKFEKGKRKDPLYGAYPTILDLDSMKTEPLYEPKPLSPEDVKELEKLFGEGEDYEAR